MKSGFVMQHRPFSQGEGIRGMRFEPGCIAAMMLLLRRTLRGSVRYSTILSLSGILNSTFTSNSTMTIRNLTLLLFLTLLIILTSCLQCITGGQLHIKKNYVSNVCGLVNGVYVREIKVDSFQNDIPAKYTTIRSAPLYRQGASPNNDPKKLYFDKDCKEVYLWDKDNIVDTVKGPMTFNKENWYLFYSMDAHTEIYMFIDKSGDRRFQEVSGHSGLTNF